MLKKKVYILPLVILLLSFVKTNAQVLCGLPKVTDEEKKTLLGLSNSNKNARKINNFRILSLIKIIAEAVVSLDYFRLCRRYSELFVNPAKSTMS